MQSEFNDIELIRSVLLDNNTAAYGKLMNRYTIQVYNAAIRLVNDEDEASDVTQQAFIQAYRQLDSWRGGNYCQPYCTKDVGKRETTAHCATG